MPVEAQSFQWATFSAARVGHGGGSGFDGDRDAGHERDDRDPAGTASATPTATP